MHSAFFVELGNRPVLSGQDSHLNNTCGLPAIQRFLRLIHISRSQVPFATLAVSRRARRSHPVCRRPEESGFQGWTSGLAVWPPMPHPPFFNLIEQCECRLSPLWIVLNHIQQFASDHIGAAGHHRHHIGRPLMGPVLDEYFLDGFVQFVRCTSGSIVLQQFQCTENGVDAPHVCQYLS